MLDKNVECCNYDIRDNGSNHSIRYHPLSISKWSSQSESGLKRLNDMFQTEF